MAAISVSNLDSRPCTNVTRAFVITAENSSFTDAFLLLNLQETEMLTQNTSKKQSQPAHRTYPRHQPIENQLFWLHSQPTLQPEKK